jgi:type II secretory pathway pseudopilin PulG
MEKMDSPTSSTLRTKRNRRGGFTLVEILIGASISSFLMVGVLSTFLLMGRTSANLINYTRLETNARKALEKFSSEVHQAYAVGTGYSATSVTLSLPDNTSDRVPANPTANGAYSVTYAYDSVNNRLTRAVNGGTAETFIDDVYQISGTPIFNYYKYVNAATLPNVGEGYHNAVTTNTASNLREIRQIEVSFLLKRKDVTVVAATNKVFSARFILRNK